MERDVLTGAFCGAGNPGRFIRVHLCASVAKKSLSQEFAMHPIHSNFGAQKLATDAHGCTRITPESGASSRALLEVASGSSQ